MIFTTRKKKIFLRGRTNFLFVIFSFFVLEIFLWERMMIRKGLNLEKKNFFLFGQWFLRLEKRDFFVREEDKLFICNFFVFRFGDLFFVGGNDDEGAESRKKNRFFCLANNFHDSKKNIFFVREDKFFLFFYFFRFGDFFFVWERMMMRRGWISKIFFFRFFLLGQ